MAPFRFSFKMPERVDHEKPNMKAGFSIEPDVAIDLREVYFLIMHFLSDGPFKKTYGQLCNELLEHQLLPRRYHAWYSRSGACSGDGDDDGKSLPLCYHSLVERFPVPLSINIIKRRLHNNYFRTLEAVKHDASVMLSNAEAYFGKNVEMTTKMQRLGKWFTVKFSC